MKLLRAFISNIYHVAITVVKRFLCISSISFHFVSKSKRIKLPWWVGTVGAANVFADACTTGAANAANTVGAVGAAGAFAAACAAGAADTVGCLMCGQPTTPTL